MVQPRIHLEECAHWRSASQAFGVLQHLMIGWLVLGQKILPAVILAGALSMPCALKKFSLSKNTTNRHLRDGRIGYRMSVALIYRSAWVTAFTITPKEPRYSVPACIALITSQLILAVRTFLFHATSITSVAAQ